MFQMTVLISVTPLLIWWVDDKLLQRLHHAVTFDLLLSLMAAELIFSPKILPHLIFEMCVWQMVILSWLVIKACPYWEPLRQKYQAVCSHVPYLASRQHCVFDWWDNGCCSDSIEYVSRFRKTNLMDKGNQVLSLDTFMPNLFRSVQTNSVAFCLFGLVLFVDRALVLWPNSWTVTTWKGWSLSC